MSNINFSTLNRSFFGLTTSGANSLFGSTGLSSVSSTASLLSDYASIRNGSYTKLLRSYYNKIDSEDSDKASTTTKKTTTADRLTNSQLLSEKEAAGKLRSSAAELVQTGKDSLFNKKEVKGKDGTVSKDYDTDAIYSAVSDFVKNYNSTVEALGNSSTSSVLNSGNRMVSYTNAMAKSLSKVGITVGLNNKLTLDEEKFKAADMSNVKTLFNGIGSYAYSVSASASSMANAASAQLSQRNGGLYTSTGAYGSSYAYSGSLYSSFY